MKKTTAVKGARMVPPIKAHIASKTQVPKSSEGIPIAIRILAAIAPTNAPIASVGTKIPPVAPLFDVRIIITKRQRKRNIKTTRAGCPFKILKMIPRPP